MTGHGPADGTTPVAVVPGKIDVRGQRGILSAGDANGLAGGGEGAIYRWI